MYSSAFNLDDSWCEVNSILVSNRSFQEKEALKKFCLICGLIMLGKADSARLKSVFNWIISNILEITAYRWCHKFL